MVSAISSGARGSRFHSRRGKFGRPDTLSLVLFAGMTLDKCAVLRVGTLTGCPLCRESHPFCSLKNPTVIKIWLLVRPGFHPAARVYKVHLPILLVRESGSLGPIVNILAIFSNANILKK